MRLNTPCSLNIWHIEYGIYSHLRGTKISFNFYALQKIVALRILIIAERRKHFQPELTKSKSSNKITVLDEFEGSKKTSHATFLSRFIDDID
jgi:hypothetical protein